MSAGLHAERAHSSSSGFTPIHGAMLQRKCACGGSSGLTGSCSECEKKKLVGQPLQTKLRINEPGDRYEQEADRVAEQVMRMADSDFNSSHRQSSATAQRRVAGDELANLNGSMIQRAEETSETPAESAAQTDTGPAPEEGSRCPSWRGDPESISKRAAETYVQNDITPPSQATVEKIDCEPPIANGNYGCYVHFSDGLVVRVIVREKDIVVGMGPGPITTETPPPATPLCFYDYACPDGYTGLNCNANARAPSRRRRRGRRWLGNGAPRPAQADRWTLRRWCTACSLRRASRSMRRRGEFFSSRFGHDFANVRVHADAAAAESARSVHALAYTVGSDVVFGAGSMRREPARDSNFWPMSWPTSCSKPVALRAPGVYARAWRSHASCGNGQGLGQAHAMPAGSIQRQPASDGPTVRDLPIFLEKLELDIGQNLLDYGHHLYQAAILHRDEPEVLRNEFSRFALGRNVLKDSFRFAGFKPDTADKLALGTGILFKGLTFLRAGELTLDFQVDIGRGVKFEANIDLNVNPKDVTDVRKGRVNIGFVRRF